MSARRPRSRARASARAAACAAAHASAPAMVLALGMVLLGGAVATGCSSGSNAATSRSTTTTRTSATTRTSTTPTTRESIPRWGRPPRQAATMRITADVVTMLRLQGGGHDDVVSITTFSPAGDYPQNPLRSVDIRVTRAAATGVDPADLAVLTDIGGTGALTTGGDLTQLAFTTPGPLAPAARRELDIIESRLLALAVPLPRRPIGVGAHWTARRPGGTTTYQVTGRDPSGLTYTARQGPARRVGRIRFDHPFSTSTGTDFTATTP